MHLDVRAVVGAVVAALVISVASDSGALAAYADAGLPSVTSVGALSTHNPALEAFVREAGIPTGGDVVVVDDLMNSSLPPDAISARYWLPLAPYGEIALLPAKSRLAHLDRFVARHHLSGWLVVGIPQISQSAWLTDELRRWYVPGRTFSAGSWTATFYRYAAG